MMIECSRCLSRVPALRDKCRCSRAMGVTLVMHAHAVHQNLGGTPNTPWSVTGVCESNTHLDRAHLLAS